MASSVHKSAWKPIYNIELTSGNQSVCFPCLSLIDISTVLKRLLIIALV